MRRRDFLQSSIASTVGLFSRCALPLSAGIIAEEQLEGMVPAADAENYSSLKDAFLNPPNHTQNWTRWWWFGPNATEEGIAYELGQMHKQGLGGVEVQWMTPLEPEGNFDFLSERWSKLVTFTVQKAKELGMRVDFTLGTGWPYGGPWIPIELSSHCIRMTTEEVIGPYRYGVEIPGGVGKHEKLIGIYAAQTLGSDEVLDPHSIHDLTPFLRYSDPNYWAVVRPPVGWTVPPGRWKIIALKQSPTRQPVRGASLGDEGYVLNHFARQALDKHLEVVGGALQKAVGNEFGKTVRAMFCDSFEIQLPLGTYYWTGDLLDEFHRRIGYDLKPHLLALWFQAGEKTPHVRHDFVAVLSDLIIDNFFVPLRKWCEQNKLKSRVQSHGSIAERLAGYGANSIPEGEYATTRVPTVSMERKYATSSAHIYGKPLVSAESFTFISAPGYPSSFRYTNDLELMKAVIDPALRDGYQEIVSCGYAYNDPDERTEPFTEMYASAAIRHTEPWWQYYHEFSAYLARTCSILSQGTFVGDVAILSPIPDAWCKIRPPEAYYWIPDESIEWGDLPQLIVQNGFDFNLVNDQVLVKQSQIVDGKLRIGEMQHGVLILPNMTYIAVATMERVRDFCRNGGLVIATERLPRYSTGFQNFQANDQRVQGMVREVFGEIPDTEGSATHPFGKGTGVFIKSVADLPGILRAHLQPDFEPEHQTDTLLHLHRRRGDIDVYFVANNSETRMSRNATFRVGRKIPEVWGTETGAFAPASVYRLTAKGVEVSLQLEPYQSACYLFRKRPEPAHVTETNADQVFAGDHGRITCRMGENGVCQVRYAGGGQAPGQKQAEVKNLPAPLEVMGTWQVTFQAYKFPTLVKHIADLRSWTDDPDTRHFSGTARYELEFEIPADYFGEKRVLILDLGRVADASKAWLNGHSVGLTWKRPHRHDLTKWAKPGKNFLEVRVSNRLINRVAGLKKPEWIKEVIQKYGSYNERRLWYEIVAREYGTTHLLPGGLMGPVRVVAMQDIEFSL